jgi:hypothetical protein
MWRPQLILVILLLILIRLPPHSPEKEYGGKLEFIFDGREKYL